MATNYPTTLDTVGASGSLPVEPSGTPLSTNHIAAHQNESDAIVALETKVGLNSSSDVTSLDYILKSSSSISPGHKHTITGDMTDVVITTPSDGQPLVYEAATSKWKNKTTTVPDASTTVKGVVELSAAPASTPIAIGSNDATTVNGLLTPAGVLAALPSGLLSMYAGSSAPTGWAFCDGSSVLRAGAFASLFSAIGTQFGSADGTHFNLPDFRGRAPIGVGTGTGGGAAGSATAPTGGSALSARALGDWTGEETHQLSSGELAAHTHTVTKSNVSNTASGTSIAMGTGPSNTTTEATSSIGSNTAHNNLQPLLSINFIIKV